MSNRLGTIRMGYPALNYFYSSERAPLFYSGGAGSLSETNPTKFFGLGGVASKTTGNSGIGGFLGGIGDKLGGVMGGGKLAGSPVGGLVGGLGSAVGGLANNLISGDYKSGAGSAISGIGGTVGSAISAVNPVLGGIVSAGSGIVGGAVNALFGQSVDEAKLKAVNEGIDKNNNFVSNAGSFDEIKGPEATFTNTDVYSDGLLASGADEKNAELAKRVADSRQWVDRSINNNIFNLQNDQMNSALRNYAAFGGPQDSMDSAIGYGFMSDYMLYKNKTAENKNQMTNMFMGMPNSMFAFGGDIPLDIQYRDNTRVVKPIVLPIERQQNFSDEQYFWNAGREYPAGLWKHKDGTFHTTGAYGKDIQLTLEEADAIIRNNMLLKRLEKLKRAMRGKLYANGGYIVGNTYDVDEQEANRLRSLGYEFAIIG